MNYSALIVDDERPARATLRQFLTDYVPEITNIYEAESVKRAVEVISKEVIDIVFLDIQMPNSNGFELIKDLSNKQHQVIFITAFSNYTYQAIKASAVDYLMKPVMIDELIEAVAKATHRLEMIRAANANVDNYKLVKLIENLTTTQLKTISVNHSNGFEVVNLNDILYLEASKSYTVFHLRTQKEIIASRNIAYYEKLLDEASFFRIHKTYIINLGQLKGYSALDGHVAIMDEGKQLPVSKRKLNEFLKLSKT